MAKTNLFMNWVDFTFTPTATGGVAIAVAKVSSCKPTRGGTSEKFKGDAAKFYQMIAVPTEERTLEIDFGDVATAATIPIGVPGTVAVKLADVVNGITTAGGGLQYTLTPCVAVSNPTSGDHAKYASTTLTFEGFDPTGGTVDPLTIAAL